MLAADWHVTPSLGVTGRFTSNLDLEADDEVESIIGEINPGLSLSAQGARAQLSLDYRARLLEYSAQRGEDRADHQFSANASTELLKDHLFLEARASYTQEISNRRDASNGDSLNAADNFSDTARIEVLPSWQTRLGRYTTLGAEFQLDQIYVIGPGEDSNGQSYRVFLDTRNSPARIFWDLDLGQSQADSQDSDDIREDRAALSLNARLSEQLIPRINLGYVDNHLDDPTSSNAESGAFWGAGVLWQPNPRNQLDINYNSRLQSSSSLGLSFNQRHRRTAWSLEYQESITSNRQTLLSGTREGTLICPREAVSLAECRFTNAEDPQAGTGEEVRIGVSVPLTSLENERFIEKTARGNIVFGSGKTRFNWGLFQTRRDFQIRRIDEREIGTNLSWNWQLGGRSDLTTAWTWSKIETDGDTDDYSKTLSLSFNRSLSPRTGIRATLGGSSRDSGDQAREFEEFNVLLSLNTTF